jgi:serine/threonine protein kinase
MRVAGRVPSAARKHAAPAAPLPRAAHLRRRGAAAAPTAAADAADAAPRPGEYPVDTLLGGRYRVEAVAGRGASAVTYRCADAESGSGARVAVKALSLRAARGWKGLELFEREAATLRALDHPGVPRFLDSFEVDSDADRAFFLVQELVEGETLAEAVAAGRRGDDAEVARVAGALLDVLRYLGSRRPPVVHRDVTPSNIVIEGGRPGGQVFLVDFGGAAAAAAAAADEGVPGSTVSLASPLIEPSEQTLQTP